jgi:LysM repeat protein
MKFQRSVRRAGFIFVAFLVLAGILLPTAVSAAPATTTQARPAYGFYYTVQPGDTLSQIAKWNGTTVQAIMSANGLHSTRIYVGQVLYIPSGGGGGGGGGGCSQVYIVRRGDTLSQIARWYGVSVHAIARANGIANPSHIYVGQRLCIPGGHPGPGPGPGPVPPQPYCGQYHTVQRGDTLSQIAKWCGTSVRNLMYLNGIHNPNFIYVGQVIRIY